jgi:hypothetical protein
VLLLSSLDNINYQFFTNVFSFSIIVRRERFLFGDLRSFPRRKRGLISSHIYPRCYQFED